MGFYDSKENVEQYIEMAEGFDGHMLIEILKNYLAPGSRVLELGMGPGKDMDIMSGYYSVTGSDHSCIFVERYLNAHPDADLLVLDAADINTKRSFQGIYSNKALIHLTREGLAKSLQRQLEILEPGGIALHSLWYGEGDEELSGERFVCLYQEKELESMIPNGLKIREIKRYKEFEENDSIYMVLEKSEKDE